MTTTETAGSIDSVANSLLVAQEEPKEPANDAAQADAETQAEDAVEETDIPEDDGEPVETDETSDEDDGGQELQRFRVKVDGEEVEVTLDDLKRSFAGQGYIQKRMQEVAAVKKQAEMEAQALNQERAQLAQALAAYQQQIEAAGAPKPPNRELLKTDPFRYLEEEAAYRESMEQRQQLAQQQAYLAQQQAAQHERAMQAHLAEQANLLKERIPAFADAKTAGELRKSLVEVGTSYGFSSQELEGWTDARAVQVLHDAMKYRQLLATKDRAKEQVKPASPTVRPTARRADIPAKTAEKVRARMKSTGSVDDVAAFLLQKG